MQQQWRGCFLKLGQFMPQFAVKAFAIALVPRAARFDVGRLAANSCDPFPKSKGIHVRAIVLTYVHKNASRDEQLAKRLNDVGCPGIGRGFAAEQELSPEAA